MVFPDDENGDVLRRMHDDGVDLTCPRIVNFEHVFPDERSAQSFASEVRPEVVRVEVYAAQDDSLLARLLSGLTGKKPPFEAQCQVRIVPTHDAITATETKLAAMAERFGGRADGWGSMSNPDGSPTNP